MEEQATFQVIFLFGGWCEGVIFSFGVIFLETFFCSYIHIYSYIHIMYYMYTIVYYD